MNIEKVKNFNQKMLAIFISIIVIGASIGLISLIVFIASDLLQSKRTNTNVLLADEKVEELKKNSLRQQIISFESPSLIDTLNLVYLISANVKTLDSPEKTRIEIADEISYNREFGSGRKYSRNRYYGTFNNLILYDAKNNNSKKICDFRFVGKQLNYYYYDDDILFAFVGAENDTDDDGKINFGDFKSLFLYSLTTGKIEKISYPNSTLESYEFIEGKKDILITFGFDRNKNSKFESEAEPTLLLKYNYKIKELTPIIGKKLEEEIQNIIDKN